MTVCSICWAGRVLVPYRPQPILQPLQAGKPGMEGNMGDSDNHGLIYYMYAREDQSGYVGGRVEPERRLDGQQFTKLGPKYQHD